MAGGQCGQDTFRLLLASSRGGADQGLALAKWAARLRRLLNTPSRAARPMAYGRAGYRGAAHGYRLRCGRTAVFGSVRSPYARSRDTRDAALSSKPLRCWTGAMR